MGVYWLNKEDKKWYPLSKLTYDKGYEIVCEMRLMSDSTGTKHWLIAQAMENGEVVLNTEVNGKCGIKKTDDPALQPHRYTNYKFKMATGSKVAFRHLRGTSATSHNDGLAAEHMFETLKRVIGLYKPKSKPGGHLSNSGHLPPSAYAGGHLSNSGNLPPSNTSSYAAATNTYSNRGCSENKEQDVFALSGSYY